MHGLRGRRPPVRGVSAADHGLGLFSAGNDHTAAIRVEYWDAAPPAPDSNPAGGRPVAAEFPVRIGDGPLLLQGMEVSEYEELDPPPFSGPARARVTCTGREEAHRLTYEEIELFYEGVERWVVQLWPDTTGQAPSNGDTV
ncbi:hypothetical protein [Streptomyces sp. NPDC002851]